MSKTVEEKTIRIPDPARQYEKTPAEVIATYTVKDENGEDVLVSYKKVLTKKTGENVTVLKLSDIDAHLKDALTSVADKALIAEAYPSTKPEDLHSKARWGLGCPYNCRRFWEFKPNEKVDSWIPVDEAAHAGPQPKVLETIITPLTDEESKETGESSTSYMVEYSDGSVVFEPQLPEPNTGYLHWKDSSFICDRCGGNIILEKP